MLARGFSPSCRDQKERSHKGNPKKPLETKHLISPIKRAKIRSQERALIVESCINERVRSSFRQGGRPSSWPIGNVRITFKTRLTVSKCFYLDLIQLSQRNVCCTRSLSRCWSGALCSFDRGVMLNVCGGAHQFSKCRIVRLPCFDRD